MKAATMYIEINGPVQGPLQQVIGGWLLATLFALLALLALAS